MVNSEKNKFLLDTNAFIEAYRTYYGFDILPTFWKHLSEKSKEGKLLVLDVVKKEILQNDDELSAWIKAQKDLSTIKASDFDEEYKQIENYVRECGFYTAKAWKNWANNDGADPWLIAAGMKTGFTVVTREKPSGGLNKKILSKNPKIPDVAKYFHVETIDTFAMMRRLKIKI